MFLDNLARLRVENVRDSVVPTTLRTLICNLSPIALKIIVSRSTHRMSESFSFDLVQRTLGFLSTKDHDEHYSPSYKFDFFPIESYFISGIHFDPFPFHHHFVQFVASCGSIIDFGRLLPRGHLAEGLSFINTPFLDPTSPTMFALNLNNLQCIDKFLEIYLREHPQSFYAKHFIRTFTDAFL